MLISNRNSLSVENSSSSSSIEEDPQGPQNHGIKHAVCNTISSIIRPVFSALQSQWASLGCQKIKFTDNTSSIDYHIQKILVEEGKKSGFLSYLHHPEKAPIADWINTFVNSQDVTPLSMITFFPEHARQFDVDPFFQLLEKGADPDKGMFSAIEWVCQHATRTDCTLENTEVHIARAKKLLLAGASLPKDQLAQAWLRLYCSDELRAIASPQESGNDLTNVNTKLPPGWAPPEWFPPLEKLNEPIACKSSTSTSTSKASWISKQRNKWRPLGQTINQHPLLAVGPCIISGLSIATGWGRINAIAHVVLTGLLLTPLAIAWATPLNQWDMQRLLKKALQNPLFAELWQKTQSARPIKPSFQPIKKFLRPGLTKDQVSLALFHWWLNTISIYEGVSEGRALQWLIFESANAYQWSRCKAIDIKFGQGYLEREEFVRLIEYVESHTADLCQQIRDFGHEQLGWKESSEYRQLSSKNWELWWEHVNVRSHPNTPDAHADQYRAHWDRFAFLYYLRHPEKAPTSDWINGPSSNSSPLQLLACDPTIATLWEQDPFFQLIDKGAIINSDLLKTIICSATDPSSTDEEQKVQAFRAKELLRAGIQCPASLSNQEKAWIQSIMS
jgi:hypothetical protein